MQKKILIIEDNRGIRMSLSDELESTGYSIMTADDGIMGLTMVRDRHPDMIILDIMLPGIDGYEVCRKLRSEKINTPIIMLTVKDKEVDKVLGLELGADDYITKPFSVTELTARVKTIFRRMEEYADPPEETTIGDTLIDFRRYEAKRKGSRIDLTPLEYHLLHLFVKHRGMVLTRDQILDNVWGAENVIISPRTIDSHVASLRKKLEDDPSCPKYLVNVRGVGYKLSDT
jgi:two-component system alkaline phosphatase synthesis response regulator PhoP